MGHLIEIPVWPKSYAKMVSLVDLKKMGDLDTKHLVTLFCLS